MTSTIDNAATHPLQSFSWGEFRKKTGIKVVQRENFQVTIHNIPHTPWTIGYLPKGPMPDKKMLAELEDIGKEENCILIQLEPNVVTSPSIKIKLENLGLRPSVHPLFTKYTFLLDLTKSEDELLSQMHQKTRYNIRVAQKHHVEIVEDNSDQAFKNYILLTQETTQRQGFYAHTEEYHRLMWETLRPKQETFDTDSLTAHLLVAKYKNKILTTWVLFVFHDTLYYPYGASSSEYREVMASNLMMWETIRFGKKHNLKRLDMWGALGPNPDKKDSWYGFHRFKEGYGATLTEFIGSYDLVTDPLLYQGYKIMDKIRWAYLRFKK